MADLCERFEALEQQMYDMRAQAHTFRRIEMQHSQKQSRVRVSSLALAILAVVLVGASVTSVAHALTAEQCTYFEQNGKVQICHATAAATTPYVPVTVSVNACVQGFATQHPLVDYIAVDDPPCSGGGCLPQEAPCDVTLPCCGGVQCTAGVCVSSCLPIGAPCDVNNQGACCSGSCLYDTHLCGIVQH
jgi:hypothetical protein